MKKIILISLITILIGGLPGYSDSPDDTVQFALVLLEADIHRFDVQVNGTWYNMSGYSLNDSRWDFEFTAPSGRPARGIVVNLDGPVESMQLRPEQLRVPGLNNDGFGFFSYKMNNKASDADMYNDMENLWNENSGGVGGPPMGMIVNRSGNTVYVDGEGIPLYPDPFFYLGFQSDPVNNPDDRTFSPDWSQTGKLSVTFFNYNLDSPAPAPGYEQPWDPSGHESTRQVYRGAGEAQDTYLREGSDWFSDLFVDVTDPADHVWYDQITSSPGDVEVVFGNTQGQGSNVLMRYNLSAPPEGEIGALYENVDSAVLHMHVWEIFDDGGIGNRVTSPANPFEGNLVARPVLSGSGDWVAEEATWNHRKAGEAWTTGGGDVSEHIIGSYAYWSDGPPAVGSHDGNIWRQGYHIQMELQGSPDIGDGSLTALINSWTDPDNPGFVIRLEDHTGPGVDLFVGRYQAVDDPSGTPWSATLEVFGTLESDPSIIPAEVILSDLTHVYDGTRKSATVTTVPAGLAYVVTYDGAITAPNNAGSYEVTATITEPGYEGSASGTLTISMPQTPSYIYQGSGEAKDTFLRGPDGTLEDWLLMPGDLNQDPANIAHHEEFDWLDEIAIGYALGQESNILMRWDLSAGPKMAEGFGKTEALYENVDSAVLHLSVWQIFDEGGIDPANRVTSPANSFEGNLVVRSVLSGSGDWVAEEATWNHRKDGEPWTIGGGDVSEHIIGSYTYWSDGPAGWGEGNIWYQGYHVQIGLQGSPDIGDGSLTDLINSWTDPDNPGFVIRFEDHTGPGVNLFFGNYKESNPSGHPFAPALQVNGTLMISDQVPAEDVEALRQALEEGGDVHIPAGTYVLDAPLVIDRETRLTSDPQAVLLANWSRWGEDGYNDVGGTGPWDGVVRVLSGADGSELHGLNIDGRGNMLRGLEIGSYREYEPNKWRWEGPDDLLIANLHIVNVGVHGIHVSGTRNSVIRDVLLERTQLGPAQGGALRITRSEDMLVERVRVREAYGKGITTWTSSRIEIIDSIVYETLSDAGDGFYFGFNSHDCSLRNSISFNAQGNAGKISRRSSGNTVENSVFIKHNRGVGDAFRMQGVLENVVRDSIIISHGPTHSISVLDHPHEDQGGPAMDNVFQNNQVVNPGGNYIADLGTGTVYSDNVESTRPLASWMDAMDLSLFGIVNLSADYVHFNGGGFEGGSIGMRPDACNTIFGQWSTVDNDVTVVNAAATGVNPFEGTRFVRLRGGEGNVNQPLLAGSSEVSGQSGDLTRTVFAFRVDEGTLRVRVRSATGSLADLLFHDDGRIEGHDGSGLFTLSMTHDAAAWNTAEIEYTLGSAQAYLSVNGEVSEQAGPRDTGSSLQDIVISHEGDTPLLAYLDAIPAAVATPTFKPDGGFHSENEIEVTVFCATEGSTISYTTDGSLPTESSPSISDGDMITVPVPGMLKAMAWRDGLHPSAVKTAVFESAATASGIPYSWLEKYNLPTDGSMDHEKIGDSPFTVYEEWIAGTNPNDITDILRMTEPPERTPEGFIVRWQSVADRTYTIERSQDLTAEPQYYTLAAGIQGIDGISEYVDETADSIGLFFYRVVVEQE